MANRRLLLILLAGLISISTARPGVSDNTLGSSSEETGELVEFLGEISTSCRNKTGSDETFEKLVAVSMTIPLCVMSKVDVESFTSDLENLEEPTRAEFFPKYCPQLHDSLSCLDPAIAELRKCLDPEEIEIMDIIVNMLPEGLNLACKDNGQIFFMEDANFDECAGNFSNYVDKCADKITNTTEAMDLKNYGPNQCDELSQVRQCFEEQLVECKAPRLIDIFDVFYRPVVKASPCEKHIKLDELPQIESNAI